MVNFVYSSGLTIDVFFTIECVLDDCNLIVDCDYVDCAGEYVIQYIFYYSGMPSVYVISNTFVVIIVNPCIPPPDCITIIGCGVLPPTVTPPSTTIHIDVTVSVDITVDLPSWNCGTPGCDQQVTPICIDCFICCITCDCNDPTQVVPVVIIENTITINIEQCGSYCNDDPNGNVFIIVIDGCLGDICEPVDCEIVIYNPCLDIDFYLINPLPIPDFTCELYDHTCIWTHPHFEVVATVEMIEMCGTLTYTIDAGELTAYIVYVETTLTISIYVEDLSLAVVSSFSYSITVTLTNYVNCGGCGGTSTGVIIIVSPCTTPSINVGIVININFDFDLSLPTTWTYPPCTVTPPICYPQAYYTCLYLNGPYVGTLDLCNLIHHGPGGTLTTITFDVNTGILVFHSNDSVTFPAGVYTWEITIVIGSSSYTSEFYMTILAHCVETTLTITVEPPTNNYYVIGNNSLVIWEFDISLIISMTV
jgi:hypothetical protein